jgi:hypothetical protein
MVCDPDGLVLFVAEKAAPKLAGYARPGGIDESAEPR